MGNRAKLLVGEKVEVRSLEDGFLGSWHTATVIARYNQSRCVKYDNLLCDDGSNNLTDSVEVSPVVDGIFAASNAQSNYRGLIRPLPPPLDVGNCYVHYGQCVDVLHADAWWEGVIFDHNDGSDERKIFFPDMGDELSTDVGMLRITQDWDEVTENWKPRGNWLFLELIDQVGQQWPLPVSVKQIWYEVRVKNGFGNLREWTSSSRDIWNELVSQVIRDNFKLTIKEFFHKLNSSGDLMPEGIQLMQLSESSFDAIWKPEPAVMPFRTPWQMDKDWLLPSDTGPQPVEMAIDQEGSECLGDGGLDMTLMTSTIMPNNERELCVTPTALSVTRSNPDGFARFSSSKNISSKMPRGKQKRSLQKLKYRWLPASQDMVPEAEFCPDAITEYLSKSKGMCRPSDDLMLNVRKHLSYLGWKIEYIRDGKGIQRFRYTSPDGKCYLSLNQVCQDLSKPVPQSVSLVSKDQKSIAATSDGPGSFSQNKQLHIYEISKLPFPSNALEIEPDHCPQAVVDYYMLGLDERNVYCRQKGDANTKDLQLKAKKYLSAIGWSFSYKWNKNKKEVMYSSPSGKQYHSLRTACKGCIDEGGTHVSSASASGREQKISVRKKAECPLAASEGLIIDIASERNLASGISLSEKQPAESSGFSLSRGHADLGKVEAMGIENLSKKRNGVAHLTLHGSPVLKKGKQSKALIKLKGDAGRVLRSTKRAPKVVSPSSVNSSPRTVLSWLIDNNVVLPLAKVHYRCRKDGRPMAEGQITRGGIKCSCCYKVFTLSNFEAHAGSTYHRPSANIFLEDGRSLLECQLQLKGDNNLKRSRTEPRRMKSSRHKSTSDYICSICHCGGELMLCDQCPSSFHTSCIGLKDVPDGDWFCPSCCCGLCGESRFNKDAEQFTYGSVLSCTQCEHQYHLGCLKKKGLVNLETYPKGIWFCNRRCEQIFLGLRRLLGKPMPIANNLTWTLLKHTRSDYCNYDATEATLTENCSKLNVALSVMHECFELIKEPLTGRDLVEDVIFSRWSELNRLNFRGFYTVLLERNDELITVATIRVYGEKVAEVPLIGTRFRFRRLGMCRILMKELEKKLTELGIERLVLPAVPSMLNTWTTSFGFSAMTESERLNFLDYTFLDFQGTSMCQKLLRESCFTETRLQEGTQQKHPDDIDTNENFELEGKGATSEVCQADQLESEIIGQGSMDIVEGQYGEDGSSLAPMPVVNQPAYHNYLPCQSDISLGCSFETSYQKEGKNGGDDVFKYHKRKRISACGS